LLLTVVDVVQYYEARQLSGRKMSREGRPINQVVTRLYLAFPIGVLVNWRFITGREDCR